MREKERYHVIRYGEVLEVPGYDPDEKRVEWVTRVHSFLECHVFASSTEEAIANAKKVMYAALSNDPFQQLKKMPFSWKAEPGKLQEATGQANTMPTGIARSLEAFSSKSQFLEGSL